MKIPCPTFCMLFITISSFCQSEFKVNLDFEKVKQGKAEAWDSLGAGSYHVSFDSTTVKNGKYSASIVYKDGEVGYKALSFTIPENYAGKKITLSGYIKTENVSDGFAGLWIRADPDLGYESMEKNGVRGTTGWKKYEISLEPRPGRVYQILVGGLLVGKGKMWLDDLQVVIDGKDIKKIKTSQRAVLPADLDKAFEGSSGIATFSTDQGTKERLKQLGLIWGFLKYYHPNIAKGNFNWDFELFRILPEILSPKNEPEDVYAKWINRLGNFEVNSEEAGLTEGVKMYPDLDWIDDCSTELRSLLVKVKRAKRIDDHYYVNLVPDKAIPDFQHENPYFSSTFPDAGFRLLALYRYWNLIQYYFPYKYLIGEDWKNVLEEFIPRMAEVKNETEYALVVLKLIARINDTHADIIGNRSTLDAFFGMNHANVVLTFAENKAVVSGFYGVGQEEGLQVGDVIEKINNEHVDDRIEVLRRVTPGSNYPAQLRDIATTLLRSNDSLIHVDYVREGIALHKALRTHPLSMIDVSKKFHPSDTCYKAISKDIAYINNGTLKRSHLPEILRTVRNTKGLIIDIRSYPSDFIVDELCNFLLSEPRPFARFTNSVIQTPGIFTFAEPLKTGAKNRNNYKGKVVILVNENSQSAAEFSAMAYSVAPEAIIIGSTTAAADGSTSQFYLPGGILTRFTSLGVYYPDGRETQRIGIVPDIEVKPTIEGIKNGRDEVLEKAIEIINKN